MRAAFACVLFVVFFLPHSLFADGVFVWNKGVDLYEPSQKAVILHDDGIEDLVLQVKYKGKVRDFGWLVPLPSRPEVVVADGRIFAELSKYTQQRQQWYAFGGFAKAGDMAFGKTPGVTVLDRKKVGVYDVAVLKADGVDALALWLKKNAYAIPERAKRLFADYIDKGWVFSALRIHPEEEKLWVEKSLNAGTLVPLKFTFKSPEVVYPLKISSLNKGPTEVLLYVLAEDVLVHPDFQVRAPKVDEFYYRALPVASKGEKFARKRFPESFDWQRKHFRQLRKGELPISETILPRLKAKHYSLTKLRGTFQPNAMTEDVVLRAPEKLSAQQQYRFVKTQGTFDNSLLLRVRQQASEYFADELKKIQGEKEKFPAADGFGFLAIDPSPRDLEIMSAAARHVNRPVRAALGSALNWKLDRYYFPSPPSWADKFVPILKQAVDTEYTDDLQDMYECLAAIGSDDAIDVLIDVVRNDRGVKGRYGTTFRARRFALDVLSEVNRPKLVGVYQEVSRKDNLPQDEIYYCIRGLKTIGDPETIPLVEEILRLCVKKDWSRDIEEATELLDELKRRRAGGPAREKSQ